MSATHPRGHNGDGLSPEEQRKLWDHIRAFEVLDEQQEEIRLDLRMRKQLAKQDGFDNNVIAAILKRRKLGEGETRAADTLVRMYEAALVEQGALPLEQTRQPTLTARRTVEEIGRALHDESAPDMPEKRDAAAQAARDLDDRLRRDGATMTVSTDGAPDVTFGAGRQQPGDPF